MISNRTLFSRLLRRNVSGFQIAGYTLSFFLGMAVVLTAVRFLSDVTAPSAGEDSNFVVMAKKVDGLSGLVDSDSGFSAQEIENLKRQPWVVRVGGFQRADFDVYARVAGGGSSMSTSLFLESVPNSFLDVDSSMFVFDPQKSREVPIIISKEYLMLYNHGFAPARGLPRMSQELISMVPITLSVSGNGVQENFNARIVGFSTRLNTIAAPQEFIDFANSKFGSPNGFGSNPSRLIVETSPDASSQVVDYAKEHGFEIGGSPLSTGRMAGIVKLAVVVVMAIGAVIMLLALLILTLSIHLLLYKNRRKLNALILLGFRRKQVAMPYIASLVVINISICGVALASTAWLRSLWIEPLRQLGVEGGSIWPAAIVAVALCATLSLVNAATILGDIKRR